MTAPLAWLYAIPYERFLPAVDATRANLWTLGVVATWRVVLMTRVAAVLMGYRWWAALALVMTVADIEAIIAMQFVKVPLIDIMGGIRLSASDALIKSTALGVIQLGVCSLPFWLVGAIIARVKAVPNWPLDRIAENPIRSSHSTIVFAWASALVWLPILLLTQPEQLLRHRAEQIYENYDLAGFLAELSSHEQSDFPPLYDPPPHFGANWRLLEIVEMFDDQPTAGWVRAIYLEKFGRTLHSPFGFNESQWERVATVLRRLPEGQALIDELKTDEFGYANGLKRFLERAEKDRIEAEHQAAPPN